MPEIFPTTEGFEELATVRVAKITLDGFKSVKHGEVVLNCGRRFVPAGTEADILGIYGQNGSGKTSLLEALSILQHLLSGSRVPDQYVDCVAADADHAHLAFEFDFQYPDGRRLRVGYEASITSEKKPNEDRRTMDFGEFQLKDSEYRIRVFDEVVKVSGIVNGQNRQFRSCIDTLESSTLPFGPASRHSEYYVVNKQNKDKLAANRILASERSQSFIFMDETLSIFAQDGDNKSEFFTVLYELNYFASRYLFVIDARYSGTYASDHFLPLFTRYGLIPLQIDQAMNVPLKVAERLKEDFGKINEVLGELIPGMAIDAKEMGASLLKDGSDAVTLEFVSKRNGVEFPLRDESDGIKKIVSILNLVVAAFNEKSMTVAIDEFDAGIFEYLLGEILQILESSGRGQFIFTSHNLRPVEVLDKDCICFTTTNPENRYYRMKYLGSNNNLRDVYMREIVMDEQDEELYDGGKRFGITAALRRAASDYAL